jgi:hypothetical protein
MGQTLVDVKVIFGQALEIEARANRLACLDPPGGPGAIVTLTSGDHATCAAAAPGGRRAGENLRKETGIPLDIGPGVPIILLTVIMFAVPAPLECSAANNGGSKGWVRKDVS